MDSVPAADPDAPPKNQPAPPPDQDAAIKLHVLKERLSDEGIQAIGPMMIQDAIKAMQIELPPHLRSRVPEPPDQLAFLSGIAEALSGRAVQQANRAAEFQAMVAGARERLAIIQAMPFSDQRTHAVDAMQRELQGISSRFLVPRPPGGLIKPPGKAIDGQAGTDSPQDTQAQESTPARLPKGTVVATDVDPKFVEELQRIMQARDACTFLVQQTLSTVEDRFRVLAREQGEVWGRMEKQLKLDPSYLYHLDYERREVIVVGHIMDPEVLAMRTR